MTAFPLFIDGRFRAGEGRTVEPVADPATGRGFADLTHAGPDDLDEAVAAAARAFPLWRATPAVARGRILSAAARLMRERADVIAAVMTREQGKPLAEAKGETETAADVLDWYAGEGMRAYGRVVPAREPGTRRLVLREPIGPCAAFTPWNFPALTPARKIGGALAAGCTLVLKASEETPGTALEIARALHDAGLPPGVLNLVWGAPAQVSERLMAARAIRKVSFTGSTAVGRRLMHMAVDGGQRTTMELGGNAPFIVFADADLEAAAATAVAFKFRNAGQVCIAPQRFLAEASIHDAFVDRFAERMRELRVGNGADADVGMGPLANARRPGAMDGVVADARDRGARIVAGGGAIRRDGWFFAPTLLADVPPDALAFRSEIFGPIAPVTRFEGVDEAVRLANDTEAGLAAYAFTGSIRTARTVADALEAGMVGVNSVAVSTPETPFGGIKDSGHGSEGGAEGLDAYLNVKLVTEA